MQRWISIAALLLTIVSSASAQTSIVDVEYVKAAVARGIVLWDARAEDDYATGHIPGAVNIGDPTISLRDKNTEDYLPIAQIEKALGAAGIDPGREVIVYGDRGLPSTYFAQVTLRHFGATNTKVFHDGIEGWRAAGQPVTTATAKPKALPVKLVSRPGVISESKEVVAALKRPDVQFLDVRTAREFKGEDVRAIRGGHIPGAINIPFEQNWIDPDTRNKLRSGAVKDTSGMSLKSREQLLKLYEKLDPNNQIHVYCQSGNRASQTATVLLDLGFRNVKVYDASWLGYSSWLTAPAEDEIWTNFGSLPAAMRAIENRFGELEKQQAAR